MLEEIVNPDNENSRKLQKLLVVDSNHIDLSVLDDFTNLSANELLEQEYISFTPILDENITNSKRNTFLIINLDEIDLMAPIPEDDTQRQYYYLAKAKGYVAKLAEKLGRTPTFCVTTFGCQMNARDSEKLVGILEAIGYQEKEDENADFAAAIFEE